MKSKREQIYNNKNEFFFVGLIVCIPFCTTYQTSIKRLVGGIVHLY